MFRRSSKLVNNTFSTFLYPNIGIHVKIVVRPKSEISAYVLADSVVNDDRFTTFKLKYPRFIHGELMTHRALSRNAASSRAIPIEKMIDYIMRFPAMPSHWGKNQKGMQAEMEHNENIMETGGSFPEFVTREDYWLRARNAAVHHAKKFSAAGYHKQVVNRILEPYQTMDVVCSGTHFDNFFWLRCHKDAQPEIKILADAMFDALAKSTPKSLSAGEYHLPYVTDEVMEECNKRALTDNVNPLYLALRVSASCCAQVSYRLNDTSIDKAINIYNRLVESEPMHASPFEHQARPITQEDIDDFEDFRNFGIKPLTPLAITHVDQNNRYWSGNIRGFIQHRHEIPNNTKENLSRIPAEL